MSLAPIEAHEDLEEDERRVDWLERAFEPREERGALLRGHARRKRHERLAERVAQPPPRSRDLRGNLHHRHAGRHDALLHACAHDLLGPEHHAGHAGETLEIGLVVLERGECREIAHLRDVLVGAASSADRHHPRVEAEALDRKREVAREERVVERVVRAERGSVDRAQVVEQDRDGRRALVDPGERDVGELARAVLDAAPQGVLGIDGQAEVVVGLHDRAEALGRGLVVVGRARLDGDRRRPGRVQRRAGEAGGGDRRDEGEGKRESAGSGVEEAHGDSVPVRLRRGAPIG
jgi:hypothetical protein